MNVDRMDSRIADGVIARRSGGEGIASQAKKQPRTFIVGNNAGAMIFYWQAPLTYEIFLASDMDSNGVTTKAMINDCFAWAFTRTDAFVINGRISASNKPCLAMVPHTLGYKLTQEGDDYLFKLRLMTWAKAYGIDKALSEMRANGQHEKADKLEKAARTGR